MKKAWIAVLVCACLLALGGCGGRQRGAMSAAPLAEPAGRSEAAQSKAQPPAPAAAMEKGGAEESSLSLPSSAAAQARMVIKTASLSLRVRNVGAAFARAIQLAETGGGYVQSSSQSAEGGDRADLTLRVPPEGFLPLIAALESLGTEESKSIGGQDVTEEYYDLDAELQNKLEVRSRLFQLLARAAKVSDAVQVEEQLERVGSDVNRIKGRMKYLQTMVGLSTVNLKLYSEARPAAVEFINWSLIGGGFVTAARILVQALFFILQALVVLVPLAAIGGGAAWGIVGLVRWRKKARGASAARTGSE
jgi:hypothetical protein